MSRKAKAQTGATLHALETEGQYGQRGASMPILRVLPPSELRTVFEDTTQLGIRSGSVTKRILTMVE